MVAIGDHPAAVVGVVDVVVGESDEVGSIGRW